MVNHNLGLANCEQGFAIKSMLVQFVRKQNPGTTNREISKITTVWRQKIRPKGSRVVKVVIVRNVYKLSY